MDQGSDDIRQDIEQTRASLDQKLSALENKATEVTDNVTQTVKQAFDLKGQVNERPWAMLGAAVVAGYVLGNLGNDDRSYSSGSSYSANNQYGQSYTTTDYNQHASGTASGSTAGSITSSAKDFLGQFDDELEMLKGAAFATITDLLRQTVRDVAPSLGDRLDTMISQRTGSTAGSVGSGSYSSSGSSSTAGTYGNNALNSGKSVSSSPGQSFSETNTGSADYDEIGGAQTRIGAPPTVENSGSEYYETYSPSPEQENAGSRATIKTYTQ